MSDSKTRYSFYVEQKALEVADRPRRFLEAFAAVLEHSSYNLPLDVYSRTQARCGRCAADCQLYQSTGEDRDIPCHRSELLLRVYRRYFTRGGALAARLNGGFTLTDAYLDEMAEAYYRCTALTLIRQQKPDFISLDLIMPKKSGHRLLYELRKDRELSRIPVLVVTAHARDELGRGSLQDLMDHTVMSGPGTYLEKPINPLSYVRSIQRALGLRESPETEDRISLKTELQKTLQGASAETLRKALEAVKGTAEPGAGKRPARREEDKS